MKYNRIVDNETNFIVLYVFFIASVLSKAHFSLSSFHEHTYIGLPIHCIPQQLFLVVSTILVHAGSPQTNEQTTPVPTAVPAHLKAFPVFFQKEAQLRQRSPIDASSSQKRSRKNLDKLVRLRIRKGFHNRTDCVIFTPVQQ